MEYLLKLMIGKSHRLPKIPILSASSPNSTEYSVKGAATVPMTAHICSAVEK